MKLNAEMVERTLNQIPMQMIHQDDPVMPQLKAVFGDHTFFVDPGGLSIVEPAGEEPHVGKVVTLASWDKSIPSRLVPHDPEETDLTVELGATH